MKKNSLSEHIYQYEFLPEIKQSIKASKDILLTAKTIDKFLNYHGYEYRHSINAIKSVLHDIRQQEKIVQLDETKIYFHTYNILFIIHRYIFALDFYNSAEYRNSYAGLRGSESEILDQYHAHRANSFDSSNAFTGDDKVKALIFRNLYLHRETTDLFVNFYTLFPKHMIKVDLEDAFLKKIFDKIIEHFSNTYIASENVIYKSLAITLNAYFRLKMNMQAKHSIKITNEILSILFCFNFSASSADLLRNIYISGRLLEIPIFKNAKQARVLEDKTIADFDKLFAELKENFADLESMPMDAKSYFQENPIKQFLLLFPMEFLQEIQ